MEFTASLALIFTFLVIGGGITSTVGNEENGDPRVSCDDDDNCEIEITFSDADDLQRQLQEIMPCTPDQPETSSTQTVTQPTNPNVESTGLITSTAATVPPTSTIVSGVTQPTNPNVKSTGLITTTDATVLPISTTMTDCTLPDCAISTNGYQYKVHPEKFTWKKAIEACAKENATLPRQAYMPDVNELLVFFVENARGPRRILVTAI